MSTWRIWGETGRIMAALCLITALAAVTAALILLVHEDLTERLSGRVKKGIGKKTGILALTAAGVWILVLGQSVTAAELPAENSGAAVSGNLEMEQLMERAAAQVRAVLPGKSRRKWSRGASPIRKRKLIRSRGASPTRFWTKTRRKSPFRCRRRLQGMRTA